MDKDLVKAFQKNSKYKEIIFEAIKTLDEEKQLTLLKPCLVDHQEASHSFLGAIFYIKRGGFFGLTCSTKRGVLSEINEHVLSLEAKCQYK